MLLLLEKIKDKKRKERMVRLAIDQM